MSNPPAFPRAANGDYHPDEGDVGMSIRDWFAGQALIGIVTSMGAAAGMGFKLAPEQLAGQCYAIADAMIEERNKP